MMEKVLAVAAFPLWCRRSCPCVTARTYDTVLSTRSASIRLILSHARETYLKNDVYTTHSGTWSFGQCRGLLQSIPQPVC